MNPDAPTCCIARTPGRFGDIVGQADAQAVQYRASLNLLRRRPDAVVVIASIVDEVADSGEPREHKRLGMFNRAAEELENEELGA